MKEGEDASAIVQKHGARPRLVIVLISAALIGAAYGGGRLQGGLLLRAAKAEWQQERVRLGSSLEAATKALSALRTEQAFWQVYAGMSEVLADLADKNYGLARDSAREMFALLSRALPNADTATQERLQPLVTLLSDTGQAADSLSPDARAKARQARALLRQILAEPGTQPTSAP